MLSRNYRKFSRLTFAFTSAFPQFSAKSPHLNIQHNKNQKRLLFCRRFTFMHL